MTDPGGNKPKSAKKNPNYTDLTVSSTPIVLPHTIARNLGMLTRAIKTASDVAQANNLLNYSNLICKALKIQHCALSLQNDAADVKLMADTKLGLLLETVVPHKGGRPGKRLQYVSVLKKYGISQIQSSRSQWLAKLPAQTVRDYVRVTKASGMEEITYHGLGEYVEALRRQLPRNNEIQEPVLNPGLRVTQRGDLYCCGGKWFLLCGDATNAADRARLLHDAIVDLFLTDPCYNVGTVYDGYSDDLPMPAYEQFTRNWFLPVKAKCAVITTGLGPGLRNIKMWLGITQPFWMPAWSKPTSTTPSPLRGVACWEPVMIFGTPPRRVGRDVFEYPIGKQYFKGESLSALHPTPKPDKLWEYLMQTFSDGGPVYDPFAGSGASFRAAYKLDLPCFCMEQSPLYCDNMIRGLQDMIHEDAILQETEAGEVGETFNEKTERLLKKKTKKS